MFFKVEAKKVREGNYVVQATCQKRHTSFKKAGDTGNEYVCPYCRLPLR